MVPVSAIKQNIDKLLEMILLVSEVEDLQTNPDRSAKGTVIEAHLDKAKGPVATLLVQNGTLKSGDVLAGFSMGKLEQWLMSMAIESNKQDHHFQWKHLDLVKFQQLVMNLRSTLMIKLLELLLEIEQQMQSHKISSTNGF